MGVCIARAGPPPITRRAPYPQGLAVRPDVGWSPVGQALDMEGLSLDEEAVLQGLAAVVEETVHLEQLCAGQGSLDTHPGKGGGKESRRDGMVE